MRAAAGARVAMTPFDLKGQKEQEEAEEAQEEEAKGEEEEEVQTPVC